MGTGRDTLSLGKITRPKAQNIVIRPRLFQRLDEASKKPLLWITSPPGSGKTILVSSYIQERKLPCLWYLCDEGDSDLATFFYYMAEAAKKANPRRTKPLPLLTPEYLLGVSTFTRRYFEELYGRLKPPFLTILDNYQEIPADSQFHEMLVRGLEEIPAGINMVIISRHEPPPAFARLLANNGISLIGWNDIRFTLEETANVVNAGTRSGSPRKTVADIYKKADGWVAAIVLMLEWARLHGAEDEFTGEHVSEKIFDYFAGEIFNKTESGTRDFLLKTAFLPTVSVPLAEKLTGFSNADRILSALNCHNYFTERLSGRGQDYQYHPLFREFLMTQAERTFAPEGLRTIRADAGALLEQAGRDDEAVELYAKAGALDAIVRLVLSRAVLLNMQGRYATLKKWLSLLPGDTIEKNPYLLYWKGISCLYHDLRESRIFFEKAFHAFNEIGNDAGALQAWAGAAEAISILNERYADLDPWIRWLDDKMGAHLCFPSPELEAQVVPQMLIALTLRQPDNPRIFLWSRRTEALMRNHAFDVSHRIVFATYLIGYYFILGYYNSADSLLREMRPLVSEKKTPPFIFLKWQFAEAAFDAYAGSPDDCSVHIGRALIISSRTGIHVLDGLLLYIGAQGCIYGGQSEEVRDFLKRLDLLPDLPANILAEYHMASAAKCLLDGNEQAASEHLSIASSLYDRTGNRIYAAIGYAYSALLCMDAGEMQKAAYCMREALRQNAAGLPASGLALLMAEAYCAFASGREAEGHEKMRLLLALGREYGTLPLPYCPRRAQSILCAKALEAGLETEYVKRLIRKQNLRPDPSDTGTENWPWPLRIYTMGGFQIFIDDVPLEFSGKAPQKPLELLKALIASGGSNVPVERITDGLWPDADGDLAHQSFETTLSRLRRLLGEDDCIKYWARQLSIDAQRCWVDSIALENIMGRSGELPYEQIPRIYKEAAALYRGHFLPSDAACSEWAASRSEMLKNRFLRTIVEAGRHYERNGQWESAVDCYQKGLDTDCIAEEFYRQLMICYQRLGRRAEAVKLYSRCNDLLQTQLGIGPSPETEAVYSSILKQS